MIIEKPNLDIDLNLRCVGYIKKQNTIITLEEKLIIHSLFHRKEVFFIHRSIQNEELHSLYRSPNIVKVIKSKRLRWAGHVARMEEGRSAFKILTGKPTGKRPLGRPRRRWENNIRMDLEEIGIKAGNWVDSAQDRNYWRALVNAALNLRVP